MLITFWRLKVAERRIRIDVTDEQLERLREIADIWGTTPGEVVSEFIRCLNYDGNGSDEDRAANNWLQREGVNYISYD